MSLRALAAEFLGALALVAVIVGSGIAASRLSPTDPGLQLLQNALPTAAALYVLIVVFGPISGAHLNPVISAADALLGYRRWPNVFAYMPAQVAGAIAGAFLANLMFGLDTVSLSTRDRFTWPHALSEVMATAGLVMVVFILARTGRSQRAAPAVAAYIGAAYFATSSTSFANPAVTVGRMLSDTFAGVSPASGLAFIAAQIIGGALGLAATITVTRDIRKAAKAHSLVERRSTSADN